MQLNLKRYVSRRERQDWCPVSKLEINWEAEMCGGGSGIRRFFAVLRMTIVESYVAFFRDGTLECGEFSIVDETGCVGLR